MKKYGKTSLNGKNGSPFDYRTIVNPLFVQHFDELDKTQLINETQQYLEEIMNEKQCWLQTSGIIENYTEDKFNFKWHSKINPPEIIDVNIRWKIGSDIYFDFKTKENNDFSCIFTFW